MCFCFTVALILSYVHPSSVRVAPHSLLFLVVFLHVSHADSGSRRFAAAVSVSAPLRCKWQLMACGGPV